MTQGRARKTHPQETIKLSGAAKRARTRRHQLSVTFRWRHDILQRTIVPPSSPELVVDAWVDPRLRASGRHGVSRLLLACPWSRHDTSRAGVVLRIYAPEVQDPLLLLPAAVLTLMLMLVGGSKREGGREGGRGGSQPGAARGQGRRSEQHGHQSAARPLSSLA